MQRSRLSRACARRVEQAPYKTEKQGTLAQCQSGAILLYIADKYDARVKTPKDRALGAQWVQFASTDMVRARLRPVQCRFRHDRKQCSPHITCMERVA